MIPFSYFTLRLFQFWTNNLLYLSSENVVKRIYQIMCLEKYFKIYLIFVLLLQVVKAKKTVVVKNCSSPEFSESFHFKYFFYFLFFFMRPFDYSLENPFLEENKSLLFYKYFSF